MTAIAQELSQSLGIAQACRSLGVPRRQAQHRHSGFTECFE